MTQAVTDFHSGVPDLSPDPYTDYLDRRQSSQANVGTVPVAAYQILSNSFITVIQPFETAQSEILRQSLNTLKLMISVHCNWME